MTVSKMINKGDLVEIYIETLVYGGEGLGRLNGMAVFVPDSVPGDKLKVEITSTKKNYLRGVIKEIIEASQYRSKPLCALSKVCGGCQWIHIDYDEQLRAKKKIVEENIKKIAQIEIPVLDVLKNDNNLEYRCKVQFPIQQTKVSRRVLAGYYKKSSHEIVNIKFCPVQPDIINKITGFIREKILEFNLTAYNEAKQKGLIRHLVYRYSQTNKDLLLIIVINSLKIPDNLSKLCTSIKQQFSEVRGVLINYNTANTNVILGNKTDLVCGENFIEENLDGRKFKISAESFFQVNPAAAVKLFNVVYKIIGERAEKPSILDVYAGVGSFSIWLKNLASKILAVEENPIAIQDARENIQLNNPENKAEIEFIQGSADKVLPELVEKGTKFDITILDPPRKGCSTIVLDSVMQLTKNIIIYVSCNPSTLARDIKLLNDKGFIPEFIQPVDMFCHTYHIESIVVLKRSYTA